LQLIVVVHCKLISVKDWLIDWCLTPTRRVSLLEQELLTLPEHMKSSRVFSEVSVTRSLVSYICFVDRWFSFFFPFCSFSFGHCVVCTSSIYGSDYAFGMFKLFLQLIVIVHCKLISVRKKRVKHQNNTCHETNKDNTYKGPPCWHICLQI
jgi:hypothetical protein